MTTGQMIGTPLDVVVLVGYFVCVVGFGVYFGKYSSTTKDFYFGGQRFAWWLIAFSGIATTVGSYSFVKYSEAGFNYGISSTQTYLNDWFWVPLLLLVWLPIIYYQRIQSVPEFFERRFNRPARIIATVFILLYLIGYVGINLLTLGQALNSMLGWHVYSGAVVACITVTLYVFAGGQTSVIMTDLVQGITLLIVGIGIFLAGVAHVGGFIDFWSLLPQSHRFLLSEFNSPDRFSFIGIYGQDGLANTGAFILMNQGMIMRFLALRSVRDARKMATFWILVLYPLAAITVSSGGWVAKALMQNGELETNANDAFVHAARFLCSPGVFGFVLAALMAALMSTADTLINAVSAVFVNDVYRPYIKPKAEDRHYLRIARITSLATALIGLLLVPLFFRHGTIYQAHGLFTAAVTPPIVMAILMGILWKRFNAKAAIATMAGGGLLIALSLISGGQLGPIALPPLDQWLVQPFSFGMGPASYGFTRALFGLVVCGGIGVAVALLTKPQPEADFVGLVTGTQLDAMRRFKGGEPNRIPGSRADGIAVADETLEGEDVLLPEAFLARMQAEVGDLAYICDRRWWLGGLRSVHVRISGVSGDGAIHLPPAAMKRAHFDPNHAVYAEKMF